jgi:3-dehydroquinate synthase
MKIHSNIRDYEVHFCESGDFLGSLSARFKDCFCVVDANVQRFHGDGCLRAIAAVPPAVFPVAEDRKTLDAVMELYDLLITRTAKRNLTLISIGGGILQDITGFAASTLYRGVNWIYVPTTLLAQADSCIGSKTSLNYKRFKNLIGTFYPPSEVFIYTPFLATLEEVDFFSGVGEVVKLHIMGGEGTTRLLLERFDALARREPEVLHSAVEQSLRIKQGYITEDEFDSGRRNMLNFGHCFGHAVEFAADFQVPHGQAVVVGMLLANLVARRRGLLSEELCDFFARKLLLPSLRTRIRPEFLVPEVVVEAMKRDKKRVGENLALIMIDRRYQMLRVNDLTPADAATALEELVPLLPIR